jgi:hypothetical protein
VAVCIGANKHKKVSEAIECMWQRISPHSYYEALERNGMKTEDQNVTELLARHFELKGLVDRSLTLPCESSDQVAQNYESISRGLEGVTDLRDDDKRLVDDVLKRNLYTTYGNAQEHKMLQHVRDKLDIRCHPDPTFYKKLGGTARRGIPWYIGGKIDALSDDGQVVIELKNRVNRLFNKAPFYEVIQVQSYLHLLNVDRGLLIECLKTKDDEVHTNVIPIDRDCTLWERTIVPKLSAFVDFLFSLLEDKRMQDRYLQSKRRSVLVLNHMVAWGRSRFI